MLMLNSTSLTWELSDSCKMSRSTVKTHQNITVANILQNSTPKQLKGAVRTELNLSPQRCWLWADSSWTTDTEQLQGSRDSSIPGCSWTMNNCTRIQSTWGEKEEEVEALIPALFAFFPPAFHLHKIQVLGCHTTAGTTDRGEQQCQGPGTSAGSFYPL